MNRPINKALVGALDKYFASFDGTRELAAELIAKRKHPIEALILLCARLDALASDAAKDDMSSRKAFTAFVAAYGGHRVLLNSVSIGDLYYELNYHRWLLEGMIPSPGRLHLFSRLNEPILHLLDEAGLPLTLKDSEALLDTLIRICKQEYRAVPGHRVTKPRVAKIAALQNVFVKRARRTKLKKFADKLPQALTPLLERMKISSILYERFRSESIHGATVILDLRRFFTERDIYWKTLYSPFYGRFELVEFPARFLLLLLERCIATYRAALVARGKLPPDIHSYAFPSDIFESLDLLDQELLPEGGRVRFKTNR
jgi:hypothetical protein